ncbi:hypothetical protein D3C80_880360 [compost metagenome]
MGLVTAVQQHGHGGQRTPSLFERRGDLHDGAAGLQCGEAFFCRHRQKPYQRAVIVGLSRQKGRQKLAPVRIWVCGGIFEPEGQFDRLGRGKMRQIAFPQIVGA